MLDPGRTSFTLFAWLFVRIFIKFKLITIYPKYLDRDSVNPDQMNKHSIWSGSTLCCLPLIQQVVKWANNFRPCIVRD